MSNSTIDPVDSTHENAVRDALADVLGLAERGLSLTRSSPLFGSLPELDSLAVMEVLVALEERFGIAVDDEDVTIEVFATLGSLCDLVQRKLGETVT
ncbi:acyl carrier protein [Pseudonocardia alni]|uniref:acyl carrier protein n=1 Tax=Pseudonocardia alni TaxID=33907 RepID=UPI00279F6C97|nr:acyl carrier protein [Pseudonocardia alni]